ncbi:MAG: hypothetical protein JKY87_00315 [Mariprofundus sp.]|nr:hypothetical protein [Mariprofundus sp.]
MSYAINILTQSSTLMDISGAVVDGHLIITPNAGFEWDAPDGRRKVIAQYIRVPIVAGKLTSVLALAPTHNAGHDTDNISYLAHFSMPGKQWQETWTLDGAGPQHIEITDVVIQKSSIAPASVISTAAGKGLITGGMPGQMLSKASSDDYDLVWVADAYDRANHSGVQPVSSITGLGNAATASIGGAPGDVAPGDHRHDALYEPINPALAMHLADTSNPHHVSTAQLPDFTTTALNGGYF